MVKHMKIMKRKKNYLCKYWKTEKQRSKYFRIEKISLYGSFNSCKIYSIQ